MKKSKHSEGQIATTLRQVEAGAPIAEVTPKLGVGEQIYYPGRKKYEQMVAAESTTSKVKFF